MCLDLDIKRFIHKSFQTIKVLLNIFGAVNIICLRHEHGNTGAILVGFLNRSTQTNDQEDLSKCYLNRLMSQFASLLNTRRDLYMI